MIYHVVDGQGKGPGAPLYFVVLNDFFESFEK
jgi:hypothetical protein